MIDRREAIMKRLLEVAAKCRGVAGAWRNKDEISEHARPAVLIFDADEAALEIDRGLNHNGRSPNLIRMQPEIYLLLGEKSETVGTAINAFRRDFLARVLTDSALVNLCGTNGGVRYGGCATGLARGRNMEATMGIILQVTYPLIPAELA